MFKVSTPAATQVSKSLSKFLHSLVDQFLRQAVPDWLQHFFQSDNCLRFWMALVICL